MFTKSTHSRDTAGSSRGLRLRVAALLVIAMLALPAVAAAQSTPTQDQYGETSEQAVEAAADRGGSGLGGDVGPLPFTGFDVIAMVAVALTVTGIGLALQRAVARESE